MWIQKSGTVWKQHLSKSHPLMACFRILPGRAKNAGSWVLPQMYCIPFSKPKNVHFNTHPRWLVSTPQSLRITEGLQMEDRAWKGQRKNNKKIDWEQRVQKGRWKPRRILHHRSKAKAPGERRGSQLCQMLLRCQESWAQIYLARLQSSRLHFPLSLTSGVLDLNEVSLIICLCLRFGKWNWAIFLELLAISLPFGDTFRKAVSQGCFQKTH